MTETTKLVLVLVSPYLVGALVCLALVVFRCISH